MATESSASDTARKPDLRLERRAVRRGASVIAGVDEVGRGPLAGPVVVAAVILNTRRIPSGLNDSKLLTADAREAIYEKLMRSATVSIVVAPPAIIARLNILQASLWAMREALLGLSVKPDHALIDGNLLPKELPCFGEAVVGGDARSVSIAAASVIAKVTRDRMCRIMHDEEPQFGFDGHKGYATPEHLGALAAAGPGRHHRMAFAPCAEAARLLADADANDAAVIAA